MPLSRASALQPGDVVMMDSRTSDPCVVYVGDKPKYYAQPYSEGENLHVELTGSFPRELYRTRGVS